MYAVINLEYIYNWYSAFPPLPLKENFPWISSFPLLISKYSPFTLLKSSIYFFSFYCAYSYFKWGYICNLCEHLNCVSISCTLNGHKMLKFNFSGFGPLVPWTGLWPSTIQMTMKKSLSIVRNLLNKRKINSTAQLSP